MTTIKPFARAGGYTAIDNAILDYIMPATKPNTWKVICVTLRQTIGWEDRQTGDRKETDQISWSQYMDKTGIRNRSTLGAAIQDALDCGYIKRTKKGQSYTYSINRDYEIEINADQSENRTSPENGPVQKSDQYQSTSPENGHTKGKKKKKEKDSDFLALLPDRLKTEAFTQAWREWVAYRKEVRKPLTESTAKRQLKKLDAAGERTAIAMIEQSIEHGWQGLFEPKNGRTVIQETPGVTVNDDGSYYA